MNVQVARLWFLRFVATFMWCAAFIGLLGANSALALTLAAPVLTASKGDHKDMIRLSLTVTEVRFEADFAIYRSTGDWEGPWAEITRIPAESTAIYDFYTLDTTTVLFMAKQVNLTESSDKGDGDYGYANGAPLRTWINLTATPTSSSAAVVPSWEDPNTFPGQNDNIDLVTVLTQPPAGQGTVTANAGTKTLTWSPTPPAIPPVGTPFSGSTTFTYSITDRVGNAVKGTGTVVVGDVPDINVRFIPAAGLQPPDSVVATNNYYAYQGTTTAGNLEVSSTGPGLVVTVTGSDPAITTSAGTYTTPASTYSRAIGLTNAVLGGAYTYTVTASHSAGGGASVTKTYTLGVVPKAPALTLALNMPPATPPKTGLMPVVTTSPIPFLVSAPTGSYNSSQQGSWNVQLNEIVLNKTTKLPEVKAVGSPVTFSGTALSLNSPTPAIDESGATVAKRTFFATVTQASPGSVPAMVVKTNQVAVVPHDGTAVPVTLSGSPAVGRGPAPLTVGLALAAGQNSLKNGVRTEDIGFVTWWQSDTGAPGSFSVMKESKLVNGVAAVVDVSGEGRTLASSKLTGTTKRYYKATVKNRWTDATSESLPIEMSSYVLPKVKIQTPTMTVPGHTINISAVPDADNPTPSMSYRWTLRFNDEPEAKWITSTSSSLTYTPLPTAPAGSPEGTPPPTGILYVTLLVKDANTPDKDAAGKDIPDVWASVGARVNVVIPKLTAPVIGGPTLVEEGKSYTWTGTQRSALDPTSGSSLMVKTRWVLPNGDPASGAPVPESGIPPQTTLSYAQNSLDMPPGSGKAPVLRYEAWIDEVPNSTVGTNRALNVWTYEWPEWKMLANIETRNTPARVNYTLLPATTSLVALHGEQLTYAYTLPANATLISQKDEHTSSALIEFMSAGKYTLTATVTDSRGNSTVVTGPEIEVLPPYVRPASITGPAVVETGKSYTWTAASFGLSPAGEALGLTLNGEWTLPDNSTSTANPVTYVYKEGDATTLKFSAWVEGYSDSKVDSTFNLRPWTYGWPEWKVVPSVRSQFMPGRVTYLVLPATGSMAALHGEDITYVFTPTAGGQVASQKGAVADVEYTETGLNAVSVTVSDTRGNTTTINSTETKVLPPYVPIPTVTGPRQVETGKSYTWKAIQSLIPQGLTSPDFVLKGQWVLPDGSNSTDNPVTYAIKSTDTSTVRYESWMEGYPASLVGTDLKLQPWTYGFPQWKVLPAVRSPYLPAKVTYTVLPVDTGLAVLRGEALTYTFTLPSGATLLSQKGAVAEVEFNEVGFNQITVTVADTRGNSATATSPEVKVLQPLVLAPTVVGPTVIETGQSYTWTATQRPAPAASSDPTLVLKSQWVLPDGSFSADNPVTYVPKPNDATVIRYESWMDGYPESKVGTNLNLKSWTYLWPEWKLVNTIQSPYAPARVSYAVALASGTVSGLHGEKLTYAFNLPAGATLVSQTDGLAVVEFASAGTYDVSATITDTRSNSATVNATSVVVQPARAPAVPVPSVTGPVAVEMGKSYTWTATQRPLLTSDPLQVLKSQWILPDGSISTANPVTYTMKPGDTAKLRFESWVDGYPDGKLGADYLLRPWDYVWPQWKVVPTSQITHVPASANYAVLPVTGTLADLHGEVLTYVFNPGVGGSVLQNKEGTASVEYTTVGPNRLSVTVSDSRGNSATVNSPDLEVLPPLITPATITGPNVVETGLTYTWTAVPRTRLPTSNAVTLTLGGQWTLPDGSTSTDNPVTYTYKVGDAMAVRYDSWAEGYPDSTVQTNFPLRPWTYVWPEWKALPTIHSPYLPAKVAYTVLPVTGTVAALHSEQLTYVFNLPVGATLLSQKGPVAEVEFNTVGTTHITVTVTDTRGHTSEAVSPDLLVKEPLVLPPTVTGPTVIETGKSYVWTATQRVTPPAQGDADLVLKSQWVLPDGSFSTDNPVTYVPKPDDVAVIRYESWMDGYPDSKVGTNLSLKPWTYVWPQWKLVNTIQSPYVPARVTYAVGLASGTVAALHGEKLTYVFNLPVGASLVSQTDGLAVVEFANAGVYEVTATISDTRANSSTVTVAAVTVQPPKSPAVPVPSVTGPVAVETGKSYTWTATQRPLVTSDPLQVLKSQWILPDGSTATENPVTYTMKPGDATKVRFESWVDGYPEGKIGADYLLRPWSYVWPEWKVVATSQSTHVPAIANYAVLPVAGSLADLHGETLTYVFSPGVGGTVLLSKEGTASIEYTAVGANRLSVTVSDARGNSATVSSVDLAVLPPLITPAVVTGASVVETGQAYTWTAVPRTRLPTSDNVTLILAGRWMLPDGTTSTENPVTYTYKVGDVAAVRYDSWAEGYPDSTVQTNFPLRPWTYVWPEWKALPTIHSPYLPAKVAYTVLPVTGTVAALHSEPLTYVFNLPQGANLLSQKGPVAEIEFNEVGTTHITVTVTDTRGNSNEAIAPDLIVREPLVLPPTVTGPTIVETGKSYTWSAVQRATPVAQGDPDFVVKSHWVLPDGTNSTDNPVTYTMKSTDSKVIRYESWVEGYDGSLAGTNLPLNPWTYTWPSFKVVNTVQSPYVPARVSYAVALATGTLAGLHGEPLTYTFTLPSGATLVSQKDGLAMVQFDAPGVYAVSVTVVDTRGNTATVNSANVTVLPPKPLTLSMVLSNGDRFGRAPGPVLAKVTPTSIPYGDVVAGTTFFVDGNKVGNEITGYAAQITIPVSGTYNITAVTRTKGGITADVTKPMTLYDPEPPTCVLKKIGNGISALAFAATCTAQRGVVVKYAWEVDGVPNTVTANSISFSLQQIAGGIGMVKVTATTDRALTGGAVFDLGSGASTPF